METKQTLMQAWVCLLVLLMVLPPGVIAQQSAASQPFKPEELEQILAPIALHPDDLIAQILMASTYPLEVVQAERFAKQNTSLKGDALTKALEAQDWDPSVKSLVNFPQVLTMMSEKLEWTQKLGDAFIADQKTVLDTIQKLRVKAQGAGNLKTTKEQTVIVEEKIIKIEPANPQVIYVPAYNPTVVYGAWPYPAYPPYSYYPPGYMASSAFWFAAGVGMSAAWGYAWGNTNWGGGDVNINNSRHNNINNNIDRGKYAKQQPSGSQGRFEHRPEHRKGVSYRDQGTAQKFNRASTNDAIKSREQFRGRAEQGRQDLGRGGAGDRGGLGGGAGDRGGLGDRGGAGGGGLGDRGGAGQGGLGDRGGAGGLGGAGDRGGAGSRGSASQLGGGSGSRGGAFQGMDRGGSSARASSQRGSASRGGGGGSRGGGGGGRGGGGGGGRRR